MKILYINADFDENGLDSKLFDSIEAFIKHYTCVNYSIEELKELAEDKDENPDEYSCLKLLEDGDLENEWSTQEVYFIKDGEATKGLVL